MAGLETQAADVASGETPRQDTIMVWNKNLVPLLSQGMT